MKKARIILVLLLSLVFVARNQACYSDNSKYVYYLADAADSESSEPGEKDAPDAKDKCVEWMLNHSAPARLKMQSRFYFYDHLQGNLIAPCFEVIAPPPDHCSLTRSLNVCKS